MPGEHENTFGLIELARLNSQATRSARFRIVGQCGSGSGLIAQEQTLISKRFTAVADQQLSDLH